MRIFCPAIGPCPLRSRTPGLFRRSAPVGRAPPVSPPSSDPRGRACRAGYSQHVPVLGGGTALDGTRRLSDLVGSPIKVSDPVRRTQTTGSIEETRFRSQGVPCPGDPPEQPEHLGRLGTPTPNRNDGRGSFVRGAASAGRREADQTATETGDG